MTIETIIETMTPLIYKIAGRFYGQDVEDLYQVGVLGVIKAYKNYKENGTTKFSTYAYDYIFGEMYVFVNSLKPIKLSKDILRLYKTIEMTRYSLAQRLKRIPSNEELAIFLEYDVNKIEQAIAIATTVMSLDEGEVNERSIYETIPNQEVGISLDDRIQMQDSLATLNPEEQQIIKYHYLEDLTQSEIARKLNMTQVMVSRYEKRGLSKMRTYYTEN